MGLTERGILVEVEHVKAHRTKKEKKDMSHFEKFVAEGNENADDLAKAGAMLDEGFMAEVRAETLQQEREEVYAAMQFVASRKRWLESQGKKATRQESWHHEWHDIEYQGENGESPSMP